MKITDNGIFLIPFDIVISVKVIKSCSAAHIVTVDNRIFTERISLALIVGINAAVSCI